MPDEWKSAIITPVFKQGAADNVENYCPISLTCVAGEIMEHLIAKQIYDHLKSNELLSCMQHGFLKGKSTCTNQLEAANDWTLAVQNRKSVTIAYIDFSRAFDTVSHDKLLYRLHSYGIRGDILKWVRNDFH